MIKVVITGATSFIGVHLVREWLKRDCKIYAVIRPESQHMDRLPSDERIITVKLDMGQYNYLPELISKADVFYHLAWEGARAPARNNAEIQQHNFECAVCAMEAANKIGCRLFIGAGSQAEYGITDGTVDEHHVCNPNTEYGKFKLKAYHKLSEMAEMYHMRFIWMRIFSLYGPHDYPETLVMSMIHKLLCDEPIQLTECIQSWDFLYIEDAVEPMVQFAEIQCESGVYHIANGKHRKLREYVEDIQSVMESKSRLEFGAITYGPDGPMNLEPSVSKVQKALGWKAHTDFTEGIKQILQQK